ncbi:MAG: hypothetical protein KBC15_04380 [Candidatus Levybacteria bacterium]|nr:hypothetical protein [Candidatus Levybacteria bacterium]
MSHSGHIVPSPTEFLAQVEEWWYDGELEELADPIHDGLALYLDKNECIVTIGVVVQEADGPYVHQADDRQTFFRVPARELPMMGVDRVAWIKSNRN